MKNDLRTIAKHWAIEPDALQGITASLKEFNAGLSLFAQKPLEKTRTATIRDGVAVIPIAGVITPRLDLFTMIFGGTALECLARDLQAALDDKDVKAILLDVDSPGGVAVGIAETAEIIRNASKRKPVWAYAGRYCCSSAYWLASAAERIVAHKTAVLGSIGIVSTIQVQEQPDADGYRNIEIVSSNAKDKRPDPRTPEGLNTIRAEMDALEKEFITGIATYRKVPESVVRAEFGQGGVKIGTDAVAVGMADELAGYEETMNKLTNQTKGATTMAEKQEATITAEFLAKNHPDLVALFKGQGAKAERERMLALDELAMDGHAELIQKAKADPTMTAEKAAVEIVKAEKAKGNGYMASLKAAEAAMPKVEPLAPVAPKAAAAEGATPEERAENEWNANAEVRAEFNGDKDAFVAYKIAQENGQVKIQNKGN